MSESSREIEREVEASRASIDNTIEAIRARMSIGQIVDEAVDYFGTSAASQATSRLGAQIRDNPLPLALVGIGIAWLMSGRGQPHVRSHHFSGTGHPAHDHESYGDDRRPPSRHGYDDGAGYAFPYQTGDAGNGGGSSDQEVGQGQSGYMERAASMLEEGAERTSDAVSQAADAARSGMEAAASAASSAAGRVGHAATSGWTGGQQAYRQGRDLAGQAYSGAADYGAHTLSGARNAFFDVLAREPLVVGAIGVAVGAAIGAMLPRTSVEDEYFGETRDQLVEDMTDTAREQLGRAQDVAEQAWAAASEAAEEQGLTPDELTDRARHVLDKTEEAIVEAVKN